MENGYENASVGKKTLLGPFCILTYIFVYYMHIR